MTELVDPVHWTRILLERLGLEGVSALVLVVLLSFALYTHKAARVGGKAATVGSTAAHDLKVVALVLLVLLILGVIQADVARTQQILSSVMTWASQQFGGTLP
jgi:hypothetical protein